MQFVSNLLGGILLESTMLRVRGGRLRLGWMIRGSSLVGMYNLNLAKLRETIVVDRALYIYLYFLANNST